MISITGNRQISAFLAVNLYGIGEFILDNQADAIISWEQTGYRFVERQSARNPNIWVRLSDSPAEIIVSSRQ
ncbi:MAG: hypothetical protein EBU34_12185 [Alphaproteobacteria bacterium]|nr:hypothetical protein [Alphaproteobacteria bacterium]